ncbi:MAG: DUF4330 domain-containing protein [Candidatus Obscuribacterales bacterium]|nr:DUF4330 domain-containing protein [Candidatus Obscuribacterales bacterium]
MVDSEVCGSRVCVYLFADTFGQGSSYFPQYDLIAQNDRVRITKEVYTVALLPRARANFIDFTAIALLCAAGLGFSLAKAGHAGVNQVIQGTPDVEIDVYITGLKTKDLDLFKVGEPSSITIRNQPVKPPMTITKVEHNPKQVAFLSSDGKKAVAFDDPANPIAHDFTITVKDNAEETADGYVIRGNKIKVGNQIELEAKKYRVQGVVVDVRVAQPTK